MNKARNELQCESVIFFELFTNAANHIVYFLFVSILFLAFHHSSFIIHQAYQSWHVVSVEGGGRGRIHLPRTALIACRSGLSPGVNSSFLSVGDRVATTLPQMEAEAEWEAERERETETVPTVVYFRLFTVNCGSAAVNRMLRLQTWHKTRGRVM